MFDLKFYLSGQGRVGRLTWWSSVIVLDLALFVLVLLLQYLAKASDSSFALVISLVLFALYALVFGANMTVSAKRLHDTDRSAWYLLIAVIPYLGGLILLYFLGFQKGTIGANRFGDDPLQFPV